MYPTAVSPSLIGLITCHYISKCRFVEIPLAFSYSYPKNRNSDFCNFFFKSLQIPHCLRYCVCLELSRRWGGGHRLQAHLKVNVLVFGCIITFFGNGCFRCFQKRKRCNKKRFPVCLHLWHRSYWEVWITGENGEMVVINDSNSDEVIWPRRHVFRPDRWCDFCRFPFPKITKKKSPAGLPGLFLQANLFPGRALAGCWMRFYYHTGLII